MSRPARVRALFLVVGTLVAGGVASPAAAHRDGCHRWHSCPSDTGSYVCGDLGYYSECPGGDPGTTAPPVYVDYQAPSSPTVGTASARAGLLSVPVVAERGSQLAVTIGGAAFGRYVATGERQILRFRARHGSHTYTVTATDAAGNASEAAEFTLDVDAQAPASATVQPELPGDRGGHTVLVLDGEADALYSISVARGGRDVRTLRRVGYLDATGGARVDLLAPNGPYAATVRLRDRAGNAARVTRTAFRVNIPRPVLSVERTTPPSASDATFRVTGPALAPGEVTLRSAGLPDVRLPFTLSSLGGADVSTRLADGTWSAEVTATDFQRRRATATAAGVVVDTVAPELTVASDQGAADDRTIDLLLNVSEGVTTVSGLPGGPVTLSEAGEHRVQRRVDDGRYEIRVEAADLAGNRTTHDLVVHVTHPLTVAEAVTALVMLALLVLGGWFAWRRRATLAQGYWRYRARVVNQAGQRAHRAAVAEHEGALHAFRRADDAFRAAHGAWTTRSAELARLAHDAETIGGTDGPVPDGLRLRPDERCYGYVAAAGLVENRRPNGHDVPTVVDRGSLLVTDQRVVFSGSKRREWAFDQLSDLRHVGGNQTMMTVANRQHPSGIDYGADRATRFRLDLALSIFGRTRAAFVAARQAAHTAHVATEPRPPVPPGAPPQAPVPVTAAELRTQALARKALPAGPVSWPPAT